MVSRSRGECSVEEFLSELFFLQSLSCGGVRFKMHCSCYYSCWANSSDFILNDNTLVAYIFFFCFDIA